MGFYDKKENIDNYAKFEPTHDGAELIRVLGSHLAKSSTVLELEPGTIREVLQRGAARQDGPAGVETIKENPQATPVGVTRMGGQPVAFV